MVKSRVRLSSATSKGLVLDLIRERGPISRVELAAVTGLTAATMSTVVRQLLDEDLVLESGRAASTGGRPMVLLDLNPDSRFAIGIQIGSESSTYLVVNLGGGVVVRTRDRGGDGGSAESLMAQISRQVHTMLDAAGIELGSVVGAGVVVPGPIDLASGATLGSPRLGTWRDIRLRELVGDALGVPVILDNDATAAAVGDFWGGEAVGASAHATIYMGSGIGAGILIDGTVFRGASSNTGEIGQIVLDRDGEGRPLTLEDLASPEAVVRNALRSPDDARRLGLNPADTLSAFRAIATAASRGDAFANALLESSAAYLAESALNAANLFDLDSISLAGPAFAVAGPIYVKAVRNRVAERFFARANHPVAVRLAANVTDAAAIGAATLVLQSELAPRSMGLAIPD
jgi:predicted NBD/HSP70 family sugar kinase